jgi:hypothetical protein
MSIGKSKFETFVKWAIVIIVAFALLKVVGTMLGIAWLLGGFLFFRVLPLVLVAWAVYAVVQWLFGRNGSSSSSSLDV